MLPCKDKRSAETLNIFPLLHDLVVCFLSFYLLYFLKQYLAFSLLSLEGRAGIA
jgi:hypothetical protein